MKNNCEFLNPAIIRNLNSIHDEDMAKIAINIDDLRRKQSFVNKNADRMQAKENILPWEVAVDGFNQ